MNPGQAKRISNWVLVIDLLYGHELDSAINYSLDGGRSLVSQGVEVRAGSVIFLVGVGSLVCWKIWDYWNSGGDPARDSNPSPSPKKPSGSKRGKTPTREAKAFFASFLEEEFVQDFEEFENEDPAFIQQLLDLGRLYIKKIIVGKYFGPESPIENRLAGSRLEKEDSPGSKDLLSEGARSTEAGFKCSANASPVSSEFSGKTRTDSGRQYMADNSASYSADEDEGSMTSDYEGESLPFDGYSEPVVAPTRRRERRRYRSEGAAYAPLYKLSTRSKGCDDSNLDNKPNAFVSRRFHPYERNVLYVDNDISSSETSPRGRLSRQDSSQHFRQDVSSKLQRHLGDGSETPDSEELPRHRGHASNSASRATPAIANYNSDSDWIYEGRLQPDGQEMGKQFLKSLSRDVSLSDLMGRLRPKGSQKSSLSRDNSVSSRLSDFLRRDDSICSNLSDFAASECSEFSLELSIKDEAIAHHTISSLADIEDELNTLKSSVLEIDEEFIRFASKPNPYLLKTTFSDYSIDSSSESRPGSALEGRRYRRSLSDTRMISEDTSLDIYTNDNQNGVEINFNGKVRNLDKNETLEVGCTLSRQDVPAVTPENLEDDSISISSSEMRKKALREGKLGITSQDDAMPSLEWDNSCCLKQYEEEQALTEAVTKRRLDRLKLLPDHASLELDLERELQFTSGPNQPFCGGQAFASSMCPPLALTSSPPSPKYLDHELNESKHQPDKILEGHARVEHQSKKATPPTSLLLDSASGERKGNPMTTSVDSAIHSAPASRSGSSSPVPQLLTQSMMSSGIATSWSEICSDTPDSETGAGYKLRKSWHSEESGYAEDEAGLEGSTTNLSPVHELREKEFDEKNSLSPDTEEIINRNVNVFHQLPSEDFEINGNSGDTINNNHNATTMGNTTSASCRGNLINSGASTQPVGDKVDILSYAEAEWHGNTSKAQMIRQGYSAIPAELKLENLRRIRGDNYCGIRATLYQILSSGVPVPNGFQVFDKLVSEVNSGSSWLREYSFGRRLTYSKEQVVNGFKDCLEQLDKLNLDLIDCENRENVLLSRLCHDSQLDVKLCEAAKLHMLACAIDLYKEEVCGGHVPLFGMIMFARQSCLNPKEFLMNHLNPVGDTAGLEQIEMFLLGHAFQVTLQVVRPSCYGGEDFICFYPDENIGVWPEVNLVAEDDRHYNVLVK